MSHLSKKLVAVLMMLWLPLFSGSALASAITMQMSGGSCHVMSHGQMMSHTHIGKPQQQHKMPAASDESNPTGNTCGVCHLACTGYIAVSDLTPVVLQTATNGIVPYLVSFHSITFAPLLPPPLARI